MSENLDVILEDAQRFVEFCNGLEEAGMGAYAQRGRALADATTQLANELKTTRPLLGRLTSWRSSLLICGQCERLVVTASHTEEGGADGTAR